MSCFCFSFYDYYFVEKESAQTICNLHTNTKINFYNIYFIFNNEWNLQKFTPFVCVLNRRYSRAIEDNELCGGCCLYLWKKAHFVCNQINPNSRLLYQTSTSNEHFLSTRLLQSKEMRKKNEIKIHFKETLHRSVFVMKLCVFNCIHCFMIVFDRLEFQNKNKNH